MSSGSRTPLLNRQDWVYSLSLLIPLIVYNLALKVAMVWQPGLEPALDLMQSNVFFNLGYALLWIGLLAAVRQGKAHRAVIVLFHATTMLVVIITTCAYQYFQHTGTTLGYNAIARWPPWFFEEEFKQMTFQREVSLLVWVLLAVALLYVALGPWLLAGAVERLRGRPGREEPIAQRTETSFLAPSGLFLLALAFVSLSLPIGSSPAGANESSLAMDPVLNIVLSGAEQTSTEEDYYSKALRAGEHPAAHARLTETLRTEKRNVVLIHLESTRAQSVTPYNEDLKTMPFLNELAKSSLLAEQAHVILPRSAKGSVAANCGIEPPLYSGPEFDPGGIPAPCLASLLKGQGYRTVFFQSTWNIDPSIVENFGYEEFYTSGSMDAEGYQVTNTFGYEEDIMLEPSEEWLKENANDKPFLAQYFTGTGDYGYECVPNRYGYEYFSQDEELDRYHNCLRMLDHFLKNLFEQYKELGLYEDTIFVIYGDHGEGFGEHGREMHGDTIWEEGLRIPLIVHARGWFESSERVEELASQIDILPTVLDMLGYEVENGEYPGYSLLRPLPEDRTLNFSCITNRKCLASLKGNEKYIYHYNNQPDELFDLLKDPLEKHNLASERSKEELDERRQRLLEWRTKVNAQYGKTYR